MGLDVVMILKVLKKMSQDQIKTLSYDLAEAFRSELHAPINVSDNGGSIGILKALTTSDVENLINDIEILDGEWFEISLSGKFYAPGYERGPLPFYIAIASWLENAIPGVEVWYGAYDYGHLYRFDAETRDELFAYYRKESNKHNPK